MEEGSAIQVGPPHNRECKHGRSGSREQLERPVGRYQAAKEQAQARPASEDPPSPSHTGSARAMITRLHGLTPTDADLTFCCTLMVNLLHEVTRPFSLSHSLTET
jgi:hypothetical protein